MKTLLTASLFLFLSSCNLLQIRDFSHQKKWALVISAGGVRSLAAVGFLDQTKTQDIFPEMIAGLGFSSLFASLYAKSNSLNDITWAIFKLKQRRFFTKKTSVFKKQAILKKMLQESFSFFKFQSSFSCPYKSEGHSLQIESFLNTQKFESKALQKVLARCSSFPPFLFNKTTRFLGAPFEIEELFKKLKKKAIDKYFF